MAESQRVRANCRFCGYLCGLIATVENGRITDIEADANRYPYDIDIQRRCTRWRANLEFLDHPARVNFPLKRVGERGSGQWQQVNWDDALDDISERLQSLKDRYGAETLATSIGAPHATYWPLHRFMNLFGSPNNMGIGQICWNPAVWINTLTYGWPIENEMDPQLTACAMLWGTNPAVSDHSLFWQNIQQFSQTGKPLIVVDPRRTQTAEKATLWLPARPGTDAYLALGLLHTVIFHELYDRTFVETWCTGFEQLKDHLKEFSPSSVAEITGVDAGLIIEAASIYAGHHPASLITGRGIDQIGLNTVPTHRALSILRAISGNLDIPGSSHIGEMPDFIPEVELELNEMLSEIQQKKQLNEGHLGLQSYSGYAAVKKITEHSGRRLPQRYLTSAHPDLVWQAMINGIPYPVRALVVMGSDPLLTQANSHHIHRALHSLDLLVALEYFRTPTAMLADYILPAAGGLERPLFQTPAGIANLAYGGDRAISPYYERRTDYFFWRELGLRMDQSEYWPWETLGDAFGDILAPAGISWELFCETGLYHLPGPYRKHENMDPKTGKPSGFGTESGKVELYSRLMANLGGDTLPVPHLPEKTTTSYPLTLITGARRQPFYASSYHQIDSLYTKHMKARAELSKDTALKYGLENGDWIRIETRTGPACFQVKLAVMADEVISVEYGWWYPQALAAEPGLSGAWISNANALTDADINKSDPLIGTWTYNGIPCRIIRLSEENLKTEMESLNER